jgi:hypothetical protein
MPYHALATDYDGTLAMDGCVDEAVVAALRQLRSIGYQLILVTGRELDDLMQVFPAIHLFSRVVAENGAVVYDPATQASRVLGQPPSQQFVDVLRQRGVERLSVGQAIVGTWRPYLETVEAVIRELELDLQIILNKNAVMVLPAGVHKGTGLKVAFDQVGILPHQAVAVGDAENDQHLLNLCGYGVAVANALPELKAIADWVTPSERGAGVVELIEQLISAS